MTQVPTISTCRIRAQSIHNEVANGASIDGSTSCNSTIDAFINFKPERISFVFDFIFDALNMPNVSHEYVEGWEFGLSDAYVSTISYNSNGKYISQDKRFTCIHEICNILNIR